MLKIGYEAIWLQGVARAGTDPGHLQSRHVTTIDVQALGIDSSGGVLFHGVTAGLEYSF